MQRSRIKPVCVEKVRLVEEYSRAVSEAFLAGAGLATKSGREFQAALAILEASNDNCATVRIALRRHVEDHGY